jgi:cruciform cutting endonuclease 1
VQEWTLRVGVFEGMLYAVLYALGCERQRELQQAGARPGPVVLGVEPRRVGAYWEDRLGISSASTSEEKGKGKGKKASKEGKKVKINLAGEWLRAGMIMGGVDSSVRLSVADDLELRALVDAYLRRWAGKSNPKTSVSKAKAKAGEQGQAVAEDDGAVIEPPDVRKMDDLADCLVQGVTWLEWQAMRQRISTEGLDAVLQLERGKR